MLDASMELLCQLGQRQGHSSRQLQAASQGARETRSGLRFS